MELSREFIENSIVYNGFLDQRNGFDQETIDEIITITLKETNDHEHFILLIKKIKSFRYQEARQHFFFNGGQYPGEFYPLRFVIKSLLKGLIATSSISRLSEITDSKIRWQKYDDQQDRNDPQGHHNLVYREFKKVVTLEDLEKFNNFFQNYILDLVFGFAEIFIRRWRYTIDYLRVDKQFEEAYAKGAINLEKFEKDLEEAKAFIPGPSDLVPCDDKPAHLTDNL
ncbi:MAG: hypothetical protein NT004_07745 [Bacteroidetes bacterium]|nr:hypothetical protein [Bacteroidota bacterium]